MGNHVDQLEKVENLVNTLHKDFKKFNKQTIWRYANLICCLLETEDLVTPEGFNKRQTEKKYE